MPFTAAGFSSSCQYRFACTGPTKVHKTPYVGSFPEPVYSSSVSATSFSPGTIWKALLGAVSALKHPIMTGGRDVACLLPRKLTPHRLLESRRKHSHHFAHRYRVKNQFTSTSIWQSQQKCQLVLAKSSSGIFWRIPQLYPQSSTFAFPWNLEGSRWGLLSHHQAVQRGSWASGWPQAERRALHMKQLPG